MSETTIVDYINSTNTNGMGFEATLERFNDQLRASGHKDSFIHDSNRRIQHVWAVIQDVDPRFDIHRADPDTIVWISNQLSDRSERARREYVRSFGRFLNFATRSPIYHERSCYNKASGYFLFSGPNVRSFEDDISRYVDSLKANNGTPSSIRTQEKFIRHCLKLLVDRYGSIDLDSIDGRTFDELADMMDGVSEHLGLNYLAAFGQFMAFMTGRNPHRDVRRSIKQRDFSAFLESKVNGSRFSEELGTYLEWMRKAGLKDLTMRNKILAINACVNRLERIRPGFTLESVNHDDLIALRMDMSDLKESTTKQFIYQFGAFLGRVTGFDPYRDCRLLWNEVEPERTFIHEREWFKLMTEASVEERLILALAAGMGLRRAEIASIRLTDIDGDRITIRGKGHGPDGKVVTVNIPNPVKTAIRDYMVFRQTVLNTHGDRSEGHLLVKSTLYAGEYMIPDNVGDAIHRLSKRCGIDMSTHSLRRLYATTLYKVGTDINTIRVMMRHADVNTTLRCYIEADTERSRKAQNSLDDLLFT